MDTKQALKSWPPTSRLISERAWRRRVKTDYVLETCLTYVNFGATVIDVGAAQGIYSLAFAHKVGHSGQVYSFEPNPDSFDMLRRRTWRTNIKVYQEAISDCRGVAQLAVPLLDQGGADAGLGSLAFRPVSAATHVVATRTLDEALGVIRQQVSFIKVDVEGWEPEVIAGAARTLEESRPTLVVEIEERHLRPRGLSVNGVIDQICSYGYNCFAVSDRALMPISNFEVKIHQQEEHLEAGRLDLYTNNFVFTGQDR